LGFEVHSAAVDPRKRTIHPQSGVDYDRFITSYQDSKIKYGLDILKEFVYSVLKCDIFIFTASGSFSASLAFLKFFRKLSYLDLEFLQLFNKQIVVIVNGSNLRSNAMLLDDMRNNQNVSDEQVNAFAKHLQHELDKANENLSNLRASKLYGKVDLMLSMGIDAHLLEDFVIRRQMINLANFKFNLSNNSPPLIVHAPTERNIKGTSYVLTAIENLQSRGVDFEFKLIENLPMNEVRKILHSSDIVVDQLILPAHGRLSVEAMASGNAVIGSVIPGEYGYRSDLPIMHTTPSKLADDLQNLIQDSELREDMQHRGRTFVEEYHCHIKECERIMTKLLE
jgi:glycosyltransferase involved in cell wall biosynthesis